MSRVTLDVEIPEGAILELSTRYPQSGADRGKVVRLSTHRLSVPVATDSEGLDVRDRLGGSAPPAAHGDPRDPSLTEDELIRAHGGIDPLTD